MKQNLVVLLLLPAFFILHNYNGIFGFMPFGQIAIFFLGYVLTAALIFSLFYFFTKSTLKAATGSVCLLCFLLFFGPYHDFAKSASNRSVISSYKVIVPVSLLVAGLLIRYFFKHPVAASKFMRYASLLFGLLLVMEVVISAYRLYVYATDKNLVYHEKPICDQYKSCNQPDSLKPDIYFIVMDEYTNNEMLKTFWNYDNSGFTDSLSAKGFKVLPESKSNYNNTTSSLSSTFNMNYIPGRKGTSESRRLTLQAVNSISNNETFCLLQKEGYTIRFLAPFKNRIEENNLEDYFAYYYNKPLWLSTLPGRLQRDVLWNFNGQLAAFKKQSTDTIPYREKVNDVFETIQSVKATTDTTLNRKPKFVYGHLLITHSPHLFDSAGNPSARYYTKKLTDSYITQVKFANKVILDLVDHIQKNNKRNTVIIIEGDHGFREFPPAEMQNSFPNLSAWYFPGNNYTRLYPQMSPVNTFRVIFNHYFCQNLPLLKDSSILVVNYE